MSDEQGVEEQVVTPTQDDPTSEPQVEEQGQAPEQVDGTEETDTSEKNEPPKDNKAWAAMRAENKRLKSVLEQAGVDNEYLETLQRATGPTQTPQYDFTQPIVTADDDLDKVTGTINATHAETQQLRGEMVRLQNELREREDREALKEFPQLKSDRDFQALVAEKKLAYELLRRQNPGLARKSTSDFAFEVDRLLNKRVQQTSRQVEEQTEARLSKKAQATTEPPTTSSQGKSVFNNDELRARVRRGDAKAEIELAKSIMGDLDF